MELCFYYLDDGVLESIDKRMQEIKDMTRPRKDPRPVIERMPAELREKIMVSNDCFYYKYDINI
jgi:hypothetical protein